MPNVRPIPLGLFWLALALSLSVGILGRGYWTPDEPREADISWRMSWQAEKAVPLLAGEAFCEKPPLTYWVAGAAIGAFGTAAWVARLPNLLYALVTALAVGLLGRRSAGPLAGLVAAAAISAFLLSYQVEIWLATDAPLLASVAVALLGLYSGFYAAGSGERLRGYSCMHAALALGFLSKSAAAWMVPLPSAELLKASAASLLRASAPANSSTASHGQKQPQKWASAVLWRPGTRSIQGPTPSARPARCCRVQLQMSPVSAR